MLKFFVKIFFKKIPIPVMGPKPEKFKSIFSRREGAGRRAKRPNLTATAAYAKKALILYAKRATCNQARR
jgi:hypothetical protein